MPAVGGGRAGPSKPKARSARPPASAAGFAPLKLGAAGRVGLSPVAALNVAGAIAAAAVALVLFTGGRLETVTGRIAAGADAQAADLGFKVAHVHLQGASAYAQPEIMQAVPVRLGEPILGLDLHAVRAEVEASGWVKSAKVVRLLPDTLVIAVEEKGHMAVWQRAGRLYVIDARGQVLPGADPAAFPQLPLVVGAGAEEAAADILPMIRARPRLVERLEALVRVDRRRWDVRLKDGALIQLPAVGADSALIQLDQLDQRSRVLELGFARIDLRDPEMVVVRPRTAPAVAGPSET
jgi:cell division protein FtsQ